MISIRFDKRLDLIFGLLYSVDKDNNCNFNWVASMYPEFDEAFYTIYKKGITKEFETYILKGGLDSYNRTVSIAFSLSDNYEIVKNFEIEKIITRNSNFNPKQLSKFLQQFVEKSGYEHFYKSFGPLQQKLVTNFRQTLDVYGPFDSSIIEDFFGYSKGFMEIVLLNFSNGSYGMLLDNHIIYVSGIAIKDGKFYKYNLSTLFHEFSHPYVNPLGEKYFKNINLNGILINSKKNGLEACYNGFITLINEYMVRAIQIILSSHFFEKDYIQRHIKWQKELGYPYIEELILIFKFKDNYSSFEEFYKNEIVGFFVKLNQEIMQNEFLKKLSF